MSHGQVSASGWLDEMSESRSVSQAGDLRAKCVGQFRKLVSKSTTMNESESMPQAGK